MKTFLRIGLLVSLAVSTAFAAGPLSVVRVAMGPDEIFSGDTVTIVEVLSDSPTLEVGSRVLVRGRYSLVSRPRAKVSLSQTRSESRVAVPILPGSGIEVSKGSGEFELVYEVSHVGCMRVALNNMDGGSSYGTIYFGTPEQLAHVKREVRGWTKEPNQSLQPTAPSGRG